jgi:RecA/RadA recombinase
VRSAIQAAFASPTTDKFLKRIAAERLRVRDFELVLSKGLLGQEALTAYGHLGNLDRGQIRELYLASVEHVAPELRAKHLKIYAYY